MTKILVVDDETDIAKSLKQLLEKNNYKVNMAKDGENCLKAVKRDKPDLIILDLLMPNTNIDEVLQKIKPIKVILFSVVSINEKNINDVGGIIPTQKKYPHIVAIISKPSSSEEIVRTVKKAIG